MKYKLKKLKNKDHKKKIYLIKRQIKKRNYRINKKKMREIKLKRQANKK